MSTYITGDTIRKLRERKGCTQRELANRLGVTDKAVSKWETGKGLPDITLVEPLSAALDVSVAELLSGECAHNSNRCANMLRTRFYVCPLCGNVVHATGEGAFSCCGILLPALDAEEADPADSAHHLEIDVVEHDFYVTMGHPMTKQHFVSFIAYATTDRLHLRKLYPEQAAEARFPIMGSGTVYAFCNQHGLFKAKAARPKPSR
ncbi:helix-turn-helix domain-containing protein [Paraeggerthella hongkongensis]|uniref:XRE family transcriptional regulator n=1 Tax=Paraeggerthella hongkongensis TaxID=230658 RepID=A0A3N0BBY1_9ACTN|nr:helix-turn-helix domain-containing protein [Paraeggerthella hongkongensis]RNL45067.1 XRE family transcriptional regulator [Paraeggerthella hongkongensis]